MSFGRAFLRGHFTRREVGRLAALSLPLLSTSAASQRVASSAATVTPEMFGAKGDGRTNDTAALVAMAAHISARGGGEVAFRRTTYLVGLQRRSADRSAEYAFDPSPILDFVGCSRPLVIHGNGARIKCARSMRFGTFDPSTGIPVRRKLPNFQRGEIASPYRWMIRVQGCTSSVQLSDFELDGSLDDVVIGGPWGDTGYQIPAYGIGLYDNSGPETLRNIRTHHHALDGLIIDGTDRDQRIISVIENLISEHNGRQGCSIVGGRGYRFTGCKFNHTGSGRLASAPGAGVDIEAESGKRVRDLTFIRCEFANNAGAGLLADAGDSAGALFRNCTFIGSSNWAAWPGKPDFRFEGCRFVGPIVNAYGETQNPGRSARFVDCVFLDDPNLSPTKQVYRGGNPNAPIADLSTIPNVLFSRCSFRLTHAHTLPWSTRVIYADCTMRQATPRTGYPRGTFRGTNSIVGKVDLSGSQISGVLTLNGVRAPVNARP